MSKESTIHNRPTVVIQCMCAGGNNGNEIIAEVMWKEDFDKLFEHAEGVKENNERGRQPIKAVPSSYIQLYNNTY